VEIIHVCKSKPTKRCIRRMVTIILDDVLSIPSHSVPLLHILPYLCQTNKTKRPHNDGHIITAQIISIFAFSISWIWWVTFLVSGASMLLLQVLWSCRQNRTEVLTSAVISVVAAFACLTSATWILVGWQNADWCCESTMEAGKGYFWMPCNEAFWATVALADMVMWLGVAACVIRFVLSGSHFEWKRERGHQRTSGNSNRRVRNGSFECEREPIATAVTAIPARVPEVSFQEAVYWCLS